MTGPGGEVVYLNTTAITAGFNGSVALTGDGTLSTDGGTTTVPIDFSGNQVVTNGATGAATNVDSTNVRRAGTDSVDYQGTYDVFQALIALRDDLRNTRGLPEGEQINSIAGRLKELERVHNNVLQGVGQTAASLQNLEGLENHVSEVQLESRKLTADLEGVDLSEVVIRLQSQQNLLQLTMAATARLFDQSLLDFIR